MTDKNVGDAFYEFFYSRMWYFLAEADKISILQIFSKIMAD